MYFYQSETIKWIDGFISRRGMVMSLFLGNAMKDMYAKCETVNTSLVCFPGDTNVGRVAKRLGWVPLQPLLEPLQLYFLDLCPMLESIQKQLWPRLCKLDQWTLYELYYQLITFGKILKEATQLQLTLTIVWTLHFVSLAYALGVLSILYRSSLVAHCYSHSLSFEPLQGLQLRDLFEPSL